jgi:hypothetical protein
MRESPMALAYHYLDGLPLCPEGAGITANPIRNGGSLSAVEILEHFK